MFDRVLNTPLHRVKQYGTPNFENFLLILEPLHHLPFASFPFNLYQYLDINKTYFFRNINYHFGKMSFRTWYAIFSECYIVPNSVCWGFSLQWVPFELPQEKNEWKSLISSHQFERERLVFLQKNLQAKNHKQKYGNSLHIFQEQKLKMAFYKINAISESGLCTSYSCSKIVVCKQ